MAPMGALMWKMYGPIKRETLQISVYLLTRLNGWTDEWVGVWMTDGE